MHHRGGGGWYCIDVTERSVLQKRCRYSVISVKCDNVKEKKACVLFYLLQLCPNPAFFPNRKYVIRSHLSTTLPKGGKRMKKKKGERNKPLARVHAMWWKRKGLNNSATIVFSDASSALGWPALLRCFLFARLDGSPRYQIALGRLLSSSQI